MSGMEIDDQPECKTTIALIQRSLLGKHPREEDGKRDANKRPRRVTAGESHDTDSAMVEEDEALAEEEASQVEEGNSSSASLHSLSLLAHKESIVDYFSEEGLVAEDMFNGRRAWGWKSEVRG